MGPAISPFEAHIMGSLSRAYCHAAALPEYLIQKCARNNGVHLYKINYTMPENISNYSIPQCIVNCGNFFGTWNIEKMENQNKQNIDTI